MNSLSNNPDSNHSEETTDELLARLCNEAMTELTHEYGKHHPVSESVRDQIRTLHLHHLRKKKSAEP